MWRQIAFEWLGKPFIRGGIMAVCIITAGLICDYFGLEGRALKVVAIVSIFAAFWFNYTFIPYWGERMRYRFLRRQ